MEQDLRLPETDDDFFAITHSKLDVLMTFATAVARSHPNPGELARVLEQTIREDRDGEIPFNELTPANQLGRQYAEISEQMLLRIARNRAQSAGE